LFLFYNVNIYMENTTSTQTNTDITVADLDLLKQIVDLASSRGAFRGAELSQVGEVYNKLTRFLELAAAQTQAQQDANQAPQDSAEPQGE
jgi:hypothetical protein